MSDNELDKILEEIRQFSETKQVPKDEPQTPAPTAEAEPVAPAPEIKSEPAFSPEPTATPEPPTESIFEMTPDNTPEETANAPQSTDSELFGINDDNFLTHSNEEPVEDYDYDDGDDDKPKRSAKQKALIYIVSIVLLVGIICGVYFGVIAKQGTKDKPVTNPPATEVMTADKKRGPLNPLTGEEGYNAAALTKRPVAVVVENEYSTESVRPQWGMNEADIVLEGESEYSTRTLLFWADYTKVPAQVGPTRSARPPFIRFSQLFDSIFIHAGLSHSKGNYEGADTVFTNENVDHINLLKYSEDGTYFGRDYSRRAAVEHTGYLNGKNLEKLIQKNEFRTEINTGKFTVLDFNKKPEKLSDTAATKVNFTWSDVYSSGKCPKVGKFVYIEDTQKYTTYDFDSRYGEAELAFENLIFLLDETEYVVKANYKGSGNSETYCNYHLAGGDGMILSEGTALEIKWSVENNKLVLKTADGKEVKLNPGKSYIGYGSSNHGGKIELNPTE